MKQFYVYMMSNHPNGTLYIGVTSDLIKRVWQHKEGAYGGFTDKYDLKNLVWYEIHESAEMAIAKEKAMKFWRRAWKVNRILAMNPDWRDLYDDICGIVDAGLRQHDGGIDASKP